MGNLRSSLPVVLDLSGRLVVAVGGGPVSARQVRAFLDEQAVVRVVAPWLCEDLRDLVAAGGVEWVERDYLGGSELDGAWLVHTASGEPSVDREVAADAEARRVWCIDATDEAASAAAVAARTDVTTPDGRVTIAAYAAGDPRAAVTVLDGVEQTIGSGALDLRRTRSLDGRGWVALVGGGPGTDGLLTVRGRELLASADVVVIDRLAPRAVVDRLPASVQVIDVGKTSGHHPVPQWRINEILIEQAQLGLGVVRLKGGDPYVLGRGGEERDACEAHGIPVEVVAGVTSAVSVPAAAGIPVTHRGVARGFSVVTGHEEIPVLPTGGDHTLVLLMAVGGLRWTTTLLMEHGRRADSPVAIIERGFAPDQRVTIGTVATIADLAVERGVEAPAVIVVGDVVRLSPEWRQRHTPTAP
ncbi:uroporphyrinogen-III C-methyltransferase [Humibacillus xanthopallidus]|uniref:Uroporphyrinogen-III C-methyltransferase n=1 Tax=Humibacillus xanthopallidus TaxID=412689 RepID=A0A543PKH3_9MICO|nr:uroporphyrinogen-III C-methyltransferase [Humibacillus xanthopallidus]TQN44581.1 uroporphyrinogen-III C-methyltransferase [Humibacillus xanthopallidus]